MIWVRVLAEQGMRSLLRKVFEEVRNELSHMHCARAYSFNRSLCRVAKEGGYRGSALLISHNLNLEGAPIGLLNIAKYLKSNGYLLEVISPNDGELRSEYLNHGIPVFIIPRLRNLCLTQDKTLKLLMVSFDIVIANTILMYFIIPFVHSFPRQRKTRVIWIIRESPSPEDFCNQVGITQEALSLVFQNADKVIFLCTATRRIFERFNKENNFLVIYESIDYEYSLELLRSSDFHLDNSSFNVLSVGTIYPSKGQDVLIDAALRILKQHERNFRFYIVGKVGDKHFYQSIKRQAEQRGLNRIIFTGELSRRRVLSCFAECNVFVLASRQESFPTVVLEAMAFAKPIVASGVFGVFEQIENEQSGLIFTAGNREELVRCLLRIYDDRKLSATIGKRAQLEFLSRFRLSTMGAQYVHLIESLTNRGQATETESPRACAQGKVK